LLVINGDSDKTLIVTARSKGARRNKTGIGVFLIPSEAKASR